MLILKFWCKMTIFRTNKILMRSKKFILYSSSCSAALADSVCVSPLQTPPSQRRDPTTQLATHSATDQRFHGIQRRGPCALVSRWAQRGTFAEIISAAQANQLQFVIMTEHTEKDFDTAAMTLQGMHGGVLFINGNEVSAENGDRLLVLPGRCFDCCLSGRVQKLGHARAQRCRGLQRLHERETRINPVVAFFDVLWSQRSYPDLIFALYLPATG